MKNIMHIIGMSLALATPKIAQPKPIQSVANEQMQAVKTALGIVNENNKQPNTSDSKSEEISPLNLRKIKEVFKQEGKAKCDEIISLAIERKEYDLLLLNLSTIKEVYKQEWKAKCDEIIDSIIASGDYNKLIAYMPSIMTLGQYKYEIFDKIISSALEAKEYNLLLSHLYRINLFFLGLGSKSKVVFNKIISSALEAKEYNLLLSNLADIKEVYNKDGKVKCNEIINTILQAKYYNTLLKNIDSINTIGIQNSVKVIKIILENHGYSALYRYRFIIKRELGDWGLQIFNQINLRISLALFIYDLQQNNDKYRSRQIFLSRIENDLNANNYSSIYKIFRLILNSEMKGGLQSFYEDIHSKVINHTYNLLINKKYNILLSNLEHITAIEGDSKGIEVINNAIADKKYNSILINFLPVKRLYQKIHFSKFKSLIKFAITKLIDEGQFENIFLNLNNIKSLFSGSNINMLNFITQAAFNQKQFMLLFAFQDITNEFLTREQKAKMISQCLRLNFNNLSYLMSYKRSETTEIILDNLNEFIENNLKVFKSLITLESTFALKLLSHLDVIQSHSGNDLASILEMIIRMNMITGNFHQIILRYNDLASLYPGLDDLIISEYKTVLENYERLPNEISIHFISLSLDLALENRDYATLLKYIHLPEFSKFSADMLMNDKDDLVSRLLNISVPYRSEVFNTPEGFEIVNHNLNKSNYDMTVSILRYDHNLQLIDKITNIENDCLILEELGINYYNHLVRPYAYLRNIIDSRAAFERRDKTFFENKRFNVTFYPHSDWNRAFNYPHSRYDKDQNNLYFEISSERDFFNTMQQLEEFGVHIDLLEIGGHGSQHSLSFGGEDSRINNTSLESDELQLSLSDEQDLRNLGELKVLSGSDIYLRSCSNAETKLPSIEQLEMDSAFINMASMIGGTIGSNSRVISKRIPSPSPGFSYRFGQYNYYFSNQPIYIQDNRPSK